MMILLSEKYCNQYEQAVRYAPDIIAQSSLHSRTRMAGKHSNTSITKPIQNVFSISCLVVWYYWAQMVRLSVQMPKPIPLEKFARQKPIKVAHYFMAYYYTIIGQEHIMMMGECVIGIIQTMNNQINIIVQNQVFLLNRDLLTSESDNKQIKSSKDFTLPFPEWVTKHTYLLIEKYLKTKDVAFLKAYVNENETVVKVLRTADYLGMVRFHDKFINDVLIPNINHQNSLSLLEESHKKLKNINDSQTWYNLLNMSIIYLSTHAFQIFQLNPTRFKKLNEKIVMEVLERVIRMERKNNFENKHRLYQLIMECKEAQIGQVTKLFDSIRSTLKAKKIHSKIHAKLSWKLENIPQLNEKNTKIFKYLDMNWFLKAHKTEEGLMVTLNLLPFDQNSPNFRSSQSEVSDSSSQKSAKSFQITKAEERSEAQQMYRNDTFTRIGVFYSKVNWKFQEQAFQQQIKIHYILMNESSTMQIILMDKKMQKMIGTEKVQLTIFCNTETIYTFLLNYVFWHFDSLIFKGPNFCLDQLLILIKASKKICNYSEALRITSELINVHPAYKGNLEVSQGYDFSKMTKVQLQIYSSIFGKKLTPQPVFTKIKGPEFPPQEQQAPRTRQITGQGPQKRTISPIPITPINSINKKVNFSNSSSQLVLGTPSSNSNDKNKIGIFNRTNSGRDNNIGSFNADSLANSRGDSKGSKRKIFSNGGSGELERKEDLLNEMLQVTDFSRYLYSDPIRNPQNQKIRSILKL